MAHPRLEHVRRQYGYRCGYCGVSETDAGGELTIDHFLPVSAGGDESDDNLVYACIRCNQHKGALHPDVTEPGSANRLLHPLLDDLPTHIREDATTALLEPITPEGRFYINALRLNRSALVNHRVRRQLGLLMEARLEQSRLEIAALKERLDRRELYIRQLEVRLEDA